MSARAGRKELRWPYLWLLLVLPWTLALAAPRQAGPQPNPLTPAELRTIRQQLLMHPDQASRYVHARPVFRNHNLLGYRISPGPEPTLFQRMGFEKGDVVTTLNGMPVTPENRLFLISTVSLAPRLSVGLLRDGDRKIMSFTFR